jgi:hypothetical protein
LRKTKSISLGGINKSIDNDPSKWKSGGYNEEAMEKGKEL